MLTVEQLRQALAPLPGVALVTPNPAGNLALYVERDLIGYVDFGATGYDPVLVLLESEDEDG